MQTKTWGFLGLIEEHTQTAAHYSTRDDKLSIFRSTTLNRSEIKHVFHYITNAKLEEESIIKNLFSVNLKILLTVNLKILLTALL